MDREKIIALLGDDWTAVQSSMRNLLKSYVPLLHNTNSSMLDHCGKQLRPILALLMARACMGKTSEDTIRFATATELLHNATLMHDDVTDHSSKRRGEPTVWATLGATPAVLIGDFWLSKAVESVAFAEHRDEVLNVFASTMKNLSEGEMLQLSKTYTADTTEEEYYDIINSKTATMFEAGCVSAAISVDAPQPLRDAAREYSHAFGMAFQIKDDILDYCGKDEMGKPSGVDIKEQKITLPLLGAFLNAPEREEEMRKKIREIPLNLQYCSEIHDYVLENGGIEYASKRLHEFVETSLASLAAFENSPEKEYLAQIAEYNALRNI